MKFTINGVEWEIKELSQKEIKEIQNKRKGKQEDDVSDLSNRYYGITYNDDCVIVVDKDLKKDRRIKTLIHELVHCYISSYITHEDKTYDEEMLADIVSNSHKIINEILEKYEATCK